MRGLKLSGEIGVAEPRLPSVGSRHPTKEVIERPVFHHHQHDVVDARLFGSWQNALRGVLSAC